MRRHNADNEVVKRDYIAWLSNAAGRSGATLDIVASAIHRFEAFNRYKPFKAFRREQAISFKQHLASQTNAATGKPLAKATLYSTLRSLRAFFEWLAREPGYRNLVYSDAAYFNVTDNEARIATASRPRAAPSVAQVRKMVEAMPSATAPERRDRAVVALIMLTGARDAAVASLRIKDLDPAARTLFQDARHVKTKRAKTIVAVYFPVGEPFESLLRAWREELTGPLGFGPDDPLFPATRVVMASGGRFGSHGLERRHWTTAGPIRSIFGRACDAADLPYYNPHSLRATLTSLAYELKLGPRELKAWSQNLGHESVLTTLGSYGALGQQEQADVMAGLTEPTDGGDAETVALARRLIQEARRYA